MSFPRFGHPAAAWIALAPLLLALAREPGIRPRRAFLLGLVAGAGYFGGTVYWTPAVLETFGGLHVALALVAGALLVAYLALFPAFFALGIAYVMRTAGMGALLLAPAVWVATELARRYLLGGFPWVLLGSSQATVIPVTQTASLAGVYGLSALLVLSSAAVVMAIAGRGRQRVLLPAGTLVLAVALAAWGQWRVQEGSLLRAGSPIRVALVQGNIRQDLKWDPAAAFNVLTTHLALTHRGADDGAQLVIWPESSTPFVFERDAAGRAAVVGAVRLRGIHLLFGSDQVEPGPPPAYFNAAFLLRPDGTIAATYRKMHLVPFGEFIPLKRLLFFVAPLVESLADFSPGREAVVMPIGANRLSTAICYEVVYPDLVAAFVRGGSQLLTTITNDAWYGESSAPYQHFEQASLRAVEQGRYLVRAANTGISGIVDPYGRVVASSRIFEETVLTGTVRFLDGLTFYGRTGDAFAWACVLATFAGLASVRRRRA